MTVEQPSRGSNSACTQQSANVQLDELRRRSYWRALGLARNIVRDEDLAEDVTQEAFVRAWQHIGSLDAERQAEAWIMRIVRNVAIDYMRRRQPHRYQSLDTFDVGGGRRDPADAAEGPEEIALANATAETLWRAVDHLPARYRQVIHLSALEEYSYEEIARRMDCPLGTVRSRLHRARETLYRRLAASGAAPVIAYRGRRR